MASLFGSKWGGGGGGTRPAPETPSADGGAGGFMLAPYGANSQGTGASISAVGGSGFGAGRISGMGQSFAGGYGGGVVGGFNSSGMVPATSTDWERQMETADVQQVELFHRQWGLIKDQMGVFSRELAGVRQALADTQFVASQNEANMRENQANMREVSDNCGGALSNMRGEFDQKLQSLKSSIGQGYDDHHHKYAAGLQNLEAQFNRLSSDNQSQQGAVRDVLDTYKSNMDKLFGNERNGRDLLRQELQSTLTDLEKALKMEILKINNEHQNNHSQTRDMLLEHKGNTEKQFMNHRAGLDADTNGLRSSVRELEEMLKNEMARLTFEASTSRELFGEYKALVDRHIGGATSAHDEHRRALQDLDMQLRRECQQLSGESQGLQSALKQLSAESQGALSALKDALELQRQEHRAAHSENRSAVSGTCSDLEKKLQQEMLLIAEDLRGAHRGALDKGLAAERMARDEYRSSVMGDLQSLEENVRRELAKLAGEHADRHSALEGALGEHQSGLAAKFAAEQEALGGMEQLLSQQLKEMDRLLRQELAGHSGIHIDIRAEIVKVMGDHKAGLTQHRTDFEMAIADLSAAMRGELSTVKGGDSASYEELKRDLANLDRALSADLADHKDSHAALRLKVSDLDSAIQGQLVDLDSKISDFLNSAERERSEALERLRGLDRELRAEIQACSDIHGGNHDKIAATLREIEAIMISRQQQLDDSVGGRLATHRSDSQLSLERAIAELTQLLSEASAGHMAGLGKLQTDHDSRHETLRGTNLKLTERLDVLETALVREDEELRERIKTALPQNSLTRGEFDGELHRLWQALDTHTHAVTEQQPKPQVVEERIIVKEEVRAAPTVTEIIEPMMVVQQAPAMMVQQPRMQPAMMEIIEPDGRIIMAQQPQPMLTEIIEPDGRIIMAQQPQAVMGAMRQVSAGAAGGISMMSMRQQPAQAQMLTPRLSSMMQSPVAVQAAAPGTVVRAAGIPSTSGFVGGSRVQEIDIVRAGGIANTASFAATTRVQEIDIITTR